MDRVRRRWGSLLLLGGVVGILAVLHPGVLAPGNVANVLAQSAIPGICALGMTFVILTAGIDLSVGGVLALAGVVGAWSAAQGVPWPLAWGLALAVGVGCGLVSGALVAWGRVPPFMATLAVMAVARGSTLLLTRGYPISGLDPAFFALGGSWGPVPVGGALFLALGALGAAVLARTPFGLHVRVLGDNPETARLAGLSAPKLTLTVYALSGGCAALGGLLLVGRLWSAQPHVGVGLDLDAIAAVVLGGTSLFGGVGSVGGTVVGVLVMGFLDNGLRLLEMSSYLQQVVKGSVFVGAVLLDLALKGYYRRSRSRDR